MDSREEMYMKFMSLGNLLRRLSECSWNTEENDECAGKYGWILMYLTVRHDSDVFQKDIEEAFSLSRSAVSKAVTCLEKNGLVCRESVDHDARLKKLSLTSKAMEYNEKIRQEMLESWKKMTANLDDREIEDFIKIVKKIEKNF